ncbi:Smc Chromosome segregation ATPase [Pyrenophora tritici-repentis]|nr:Smc Chromosome segregation ATPase [Pyrenophora tritici-repentis]KAG9380571.1 Smc Chromosome segregation ATPase [Pyrenophora tritici-repentis]KAI0572728.1 Smc Chromosome segregation ATPase [Pyrenophora tritici-repentis]KAI2475702.1 Smc Chromosome segregation ATPase [Pyrenophora tritici-repentis]
MSAKRPRALTNGIDVSSVGRNDRNKRRRQSEPESNAGSSGDERSDVASGSDSEDEDSLQAQEKWATQRVEKIYMEPTARQNVPSDSGIIEEIQCINFMCHEHLTVTLGPLINFIIGHNGSGKSAVLTALTICLGGKATATNRAQNLKSLIKEGKEHASVTVKIKNQGPLAYKPAIYGTSIIVERHFNKSGTSGFKLKDSNNKLVTTKKAELEDILDAFSMQIDNPMNVLTQDMARQFLNHSTPKDKYKFFLQGTQLENLNRDYQQIEQSLEAMNTRVEVKEADLQVLRQEMQEAASRAKTSVEMETMRSMERSRANQAAWARVEEQERSVEEAVSAIAKADNLMEEKQVMVIRAENEFELADQNYGAAQEAVIKITEDLEPAIEQRDVAKEAFQKGKAKLAQGLSEVRLARGALDAAKNEVGKKEDNVRQLQRRLDEVENGLYAEKVRERDEAKIEHENAKERYTSHDSALPQLNKELNAATMELDKAKKKAQEARNAVVVIRSTIARLQKGESNGMDGFPQPNKLQDLLDAIKRERGFRETPVGPIGRHVKLTASKWGRILEKQFGQTLNGFVVTSKHDQTKLSGLMNKTGWSAPIYIGKRSRIDTQPHEPAKELLTWMRALTIDNDLVRNQLIINQGIEQTVLIENLQEGSNFIADQGPLTKNVRMCFTFADGDTRRGRVINRSPAGGINNSPIAEYTGAMRMQVDRDAQIREEQSRLAVREQELQTLEKELHQAQNHLKDCERREAEHKKQKKNLQVEQQRASANLDRLEGELSEATPDASAVKEAEGELEEAKLLVANTEGILEDAEKAIMTCNNEQQIHKREMDEAAKCVADLEYELSKARQAVKGFENERDQALKTKNAAYDSVRKVEENKTAWTDHLVVQQTQLAEMTEQAMQITGGTRIPVPPGRSADDLLEELRKLEQKRTRMETELGGSQIQLLAAADDAKKAHRGAMKELDEIKSLRNHLITTLTNRRNRWKLFRSGISIRARVTFNYLLSERKFRGTLYIDHKKALLDINVQPDSSETHAEGRQTKTLSGGEKSYSTVCLLLSLWEAMGSPIRCLDEFDVFMDSVNREISMKMIIEAARRSIGRQFIFITPQGMDNVSRAADVKMIKMSDPERGQTALNLQRG